MKPKRNKRRKTQVQAKKRLLMSVPLILQLHQNRKFNALLKKRKLRWNNEEIDKLRAAYLEEFLKNVGWKN